MNERTIAELWNEYNEYRERYENFYKDVHGPILDFGQWLMAVDRYETEMPVLTAQIESINPMLLQDAEGGWNFIRNSNERELWQKVTDLENALAL